MQWWPELAVVSLSLFTLVSRLPQAVLFLWVTINVHGSLLLPFAAGLQVLPTIPCISSVVLVCMSRVEHALLVHVRTLAALVVTDWVSFIPLSTGTPSNTKTKVSSNANTLLGGRTNTKVSSKAESFVGATIILSNLCIVGVYIPC
jgi:hypothetical protein